METAGAVLRLIAIITGMSTASWLAYGGFCYVTASGNPRMIDRARTSIIAGTASSRSPLCPPSHPDSRPSRQSPTGTSSTWLPPQPSS